MDDGEWDGLFESGVIETSSKQADELESEESSKNDVGAGDKKGKYKLYHSVKFTKEEEEKFQQIMLALDAATDSKVIKWLLEEAYLKNEEKIRRIVKKKRNIETL